MARNSPLPISEEWDDPDAYIEALLSFSTTSELFINVCGGVHILDFLTSEPDVFTTLLPEDWRVFFKEHDTQDIIFLLLREDIEPLRSSEPEPDADGRTWKGGAFPPQSLLDYIFNVQRLTLRRDFPPSMKSQLPRHVAVGMNRKKVHEVEYFSHYVSSLSDTVNESRGEPVSHIVDLGSGQNYLGRTLASSPYHKHIIAIERQHQYINGAKGMDVQAKLAKKVPKTVFVHNRKKPCDPCNETPEIAADTAETTTSQTSHVSEDMPLLATDKVIEDVTMFKMLGEISLEPDELSRPLPRNTRREKAESEIDSRGTISYIEHEIRDGYLEPIIDHVVKPSLDGDDTDKISTSTPAQLDAKPQTDARVMVVSLHSCGNLVHHGVRSLILNPSVVAVAMIGCCYNLLTERLGPATYKLPTLRSLHPRLQETSTSYDPHGFPISKHYEDYQTPTGKGIKLNITARTLAVQAPYNWGHDDSEGFFTRHFFRSLLQRILVDKGVMPKPGLIQDAQSDSESKPVIIGALPKAAFKSFNAYVRAATIKMARDPYNGPKVQAHIATLTDEEILRYETDYLYARKNLSLVWSLMAFSAQVVEAVVVVDRWQFLREQDSVKECWVEPVFDYSESPRNLAVIGIKK
ncbi:hypothetical protein N7495_001140 [Penicillium taxi]|uniref:uncharacterized protein n=1 Tax=Penicillium taxi TaxID=168475 RepID=UPI00254561AD|nr:uncharacterized protein N7495_001140 [Penicillium taxi]KAJ5908458.1 hypothetical protein N7495_001140 [Penicillium taxi]